MIAKINIVGHSYTRKLHRYVRRDPATRHNFGLDRAKVWFDTRKWKWLLIKAGTWHGSTAPQVTKTLLTESLVFLWFLSLCCDILWKIVIIAVSLRWFLCSNLSHYTTSWVRFRKVWVENSWSVTCFPITWCQVTGGEN